MREIYQHPAIQAYLEENPDTDIRPLIVHSKYEVCLDCQGHGHIFRRDLDENLLVREMMEDDDVDGLEAYKGGAFDQRCPTCNGKRVVTVQNFSQLPEWAQKEVEDWDEIESYWEIVQEAERRAGA